MMLGDILLKRLRSAASSRFLMREKMFDESYNVREALDDVIEKFTVREKLIQTAKQFADKKHEERFVLATKQFDNLMADFLRLNQPVLDRIRSYRENLQKEITGLKSALATVNGMLEVLRGFEGSASKVQQLESDAQELDGDIKDKTKTAEKIDDLLNKIRGHPSGVSGQVPKDSFSDILAGMPKDFSVEVPETGKEPTRRAGSRS